MRDMVIRLICIQLMLYPLSLRAVCECWTQSLACRDEIVDKYRKCQINVKDFNEIANKLYNCSMGNYETLELDIAQEVEDLNILINLPQNIIALNISNPHQAENISLEIWSFNPNIKYISQYGKSIFIKQPEFFSYFSNLTNILAESLIFRSLPIFSNNKHLLSITVLESLVLNETDRVINNEFVRELKQLEVLNWACGGIIGIQKNSFSGLKGLKSLNLSNNQIHELQDQAFEGLYSLTYLSLRHNNITTVHRNAFTALSNLKILNLNNNPSFPLDAITPVRSLERVSISYYNAKYLTPEPFQQLENLTFIELNYIQFSCNCSTQWISKLRGFGIGISKVGSDCYNDDLVFIEVDDPILYTECPNNNYPCFNHSTHCRVEERRVDSGDSCSCLCQNRNTTEYTKCSEINSCAVPNICDQRCINRIDSFVCECWRGYERLNATACADIDECSISNKTCSHTCTNTMGSYYCGCLQGYIKEGANGCVDRDECSVGNGGCPQLCNNTEGSFQCSCKEGYKQYNINNSCELIANRTSGELTPLTFANQNLLIAILLIMVFVSFTVLLTLMFVLITMLNSLKKKSKIIGRFRANTVVSAAKEKNNLSIKELDIISLGSQLTSEREYTWSTNRITKPDTTVYSNPLDNEGTNP